MAKTAALEQTPNTGIDNLKSTPARLGGFLKDVRSEMGKVIWPPRQEVQATTTIVIATVFLFAAYFWLVDAVLGRAIEALLKHLSK